MKIAKYTLYVEIRDLEGITTKELETEIAQKVLAQCALNGTCFLKEEASRIIDDSEWTAEQMDNRPLNFINNIRNPEVWENELKEGNPKK